jgi:hypothetical protein
MEKKLCTVTFLYTVKGVAFADKEYKETVFAWLTDGITTVDCVNQLFYPPNLQRGNCIVKDVVIFAIPTVIKEAEPTKIIA